MYLIALLIGLLLLVTGAEMLVRGGGNIALALRVPALVVGLTIVAFGTSTPELAVSVTAALSASTEMALANVNGSNIANIALVLGLAAMVRPLDVDRGLIRREIPVCMGIQLLVPLFCLNGVLGRFEGFLLLVAGVGYNLWIVLDARRRRASVEDIDGLEKDNRAMWAHAALLLVGIVILVVGAQLFVSGAVHVAEVLGFSDRFIGLTVIALGTSAPEIATATVSSYRGQSDLAMGNSLGSNILNITMVLSATAIIQPIVLTDKGAFGDMAAACAVTLLLVPMVLRDRVLGRFEGALLAGGYVLYLVLAPS